MCNQPERDSLADGKKRTITATNNVHSCFGHAKNDCGVVAVLHSYCPEDQIHRIDLFTDMAAILNSIVLTEKLWAAEGAIAGKFIVHTAFRINFYCLSLIFHNKYYKRYIFPSQYLAVVPMVIEKVLLKVITPQYSF